MSTVARHLPRLQPTGLVGQRWGHFLSWAGPFLGDGTDPWALHPFGLVGSDAMPDHVGAVVYAAVNLSDQCRYVGQSIDVRDRFRGHGTDLGKRQRWDFVLVAALRPDIPHPVLGNAETTARRLLRPAEGTRTPRSR